MKKRKGKGKSEIRNLTPHSGISNALGEWKKKEVKIII
jgi:hypothetical protein